MLYKWNIAFASPYTNAPYLSLIWAISSEISVYSITPTFLFFLQKTPTFSFGSVFSIVFTEPRTLFSIDIPSKSGSTDLTRTLSTPLTKTHSIPSAFICLIIFSFPIAFNVPPCPSAAFLTILFSSNKIFPSTLIIGNSPWIKNLIDSFGYPKYLFFLKKSTVAALFSLLVIIYQGITTPYFSFALFKLSHNNSNKDLWDGNPISNVPFGPLCPNLVPCPPAIVTTANLFALIASIPFSS